LHTYIWCVRRVLSVEELSGDNELAMSQYLKRKYRQSSLEGIISRSILNMNVINTSLDNEQSLRLSSMPWIFKVVDKPLLSTQDGRLRLKWNIMLLGQRVLI